MKLPYKRDITRINAQMEAILELLGAEQDQIPTADRGSYKGAHARLDTLMEQAQATMLDKEAQKREYGKLKAISQEQAYDVHRLEREAKSLNQKVQRQEEQLRRYKKKK